MGPKASTCIILLSILIFYTTIVSSFNITRLLNNHPEFSTFNSLLTQSGVAEEINSRRTITVLVIDNSQMGPITSKPQDTIKKILETHSLLEYYDENNLHALSKNGSTVTNFFQATGTADNKQGYTHITESGGGVIFASAASGAPQDSKMVKSVASQPWNISVIQIDQPIVTPGIEQTTPSAPSNGPKASPPTPMSSPPPKKANQTEAPTSEEDETAGGPAGPVSAKSPSPEGEVADSKEPPAKRVPPAKGSTGQMTASGVLGLMSLLAVSLI